MTAGGAVALAHYVHGPRGTGTEGGTAVFLGSLGASRDMWAPQVAALAGAMRIITVDLRGHGDSPAPAGAYEMGDLAGDVIALVDSLGLDRVHLVGLSLGGAVAQTIALDHPGRVDGLTLISTAPKFGEPDSWLTRAETVHTEGTAALADTVVANWFTDECFRADPAVPERFASGIRATSDAGYAGCCHAIAGFDVRRRLGDITAPTRVIAGVEDTSTPLPVVRSLYDGIPGSSLTEISPAKHLVNVERPEEVNSALAAHWGLGS